MRKGAWFTLLGLAFAAFSARAEVTAVEGVAIVVSDLDRLVSWYRQLFDAELLSTSELAGPEFERLQGTFGARARSARLAIGSETIELIDYLTPQGLEIPSDSHSNDGWFQHIAIVVRDMDAAYARLLAANVTHASTAPQRLPDWNRQAGGIKAFYFKDPDGHVLEVIWFPAGKGDPRWQQPGDRLFMGIDHTAIVVDDAERSLRFYRDALGLKVAGESENYGPEQEHLNNVFGARLRIVGLRAGSGPGIEFLEYLAPDDGRDYPRSWRASNLWSWQTRLRVSDVDADLRQARNADGRWVSPGAQPHPNPTNELRKAAVIRDPDGHALQLIGP